MSEDTGDKRFEKTDKVIEKTVYWLLMIPVWIIIILLALLIGAFSAMRSGGGE